jgi:glycosyltransferase involved in cell wall biosynthesis
MKEAKMRSVLLLAYSYPPNSNSASQRSVALAKYLPEYGWRPWVIAGDWSADNCRSYDAASATEVLERAVIGRCPVISEPGRYLMRRRLERALRLAANGYRYPSEWTRHALERARNALGKCKIDAIWATFGPAGSHYAADRLHRQFGVPWIADYRDTWDALRWIWHWMIHREVAVSRSAEVLITVSPALKQKLAARHPQPVHMIPNGFDPEEFPSEMEARPASFDIVYTGNIATRLRDPEPLFQALDLLANRGEIDLSKVTVRFIGTNASAMRGLERYVSGGRIERLPWLPRSEAIRYQQQALILLHLSTPHVTGLMTGKIFEYHASRRPILSIPGDGDCVDELLHRTRGGLSLANPESIAAQLLAWYREWEATGTVRWNGLWKEVIRYSRREQVGRVASILDGILDGNPPPNSG